MKLFVIWHWLKKKKKVTILPPGDLFLALGLSAFGIELPPGVLLSQDRLDQVTVQH